MDELDHYMVHTPASSEGQACSREGGQQLHHLLYSSGMGSQEGGIPGLAGIHKSAFNSRIDMVVSLPGDVQTEVHSCRSNPYEYSPCYANATWSKICRDRFDLHSYGYYCLPIEARCLLQHTNM